MILLGLALPLPLVSFRVRDADEELGHVVGETAGVKAHKAAGHVQTAHGLGGTHATLVGRVAGDDADRAARGAAAGGFQFGRTLCHRRLADVFGVNEFLRIYRVIAGVVDRHAVHGEAQLIRVEAADRQTAAEQAGGVVVVGVDTGQQRNGLVGVAGRTILLDRRLRDGAATLDRIVIDHQTRAQLAAGAHHGDRAQAHLVVHGTRRRFILRGNVVARRLRMSRRRRQCSGRQAQCRPSETGQLMCSHPNHSCLCTPRRAGFLSKKAQAAQKAA
mmetsp:Transcript_15772/g.43679  ORF Transcript_15772/g.43679 Transcript_15772/m.43679 type:complete len:274 (-) Transcript_15772:5159-5980(-)